MPKSYRQKEYKQNLNHEAHAKHMKMKKDCIGILRALIADALKCDASEVSVNTANSTSHDTQSPYAVGGENNNSHSESKCTALMFKESHVASLFSDSSLSSLSDDESADYLYDSSDGYYYYFTAPGIPNGYIDPLSWNIYSY
jgi:hypothetical protein